MSTANAVIEALQPYKLKRQPDGTYRCNSPFRAGSDSHSFILKITDDEHGTWFDHVDESGGSLYQLAEMLGINVRKEVESSKREYEGLKDYAESHGIPESALIDAKWSEVNYQGRKALEFPTKSGKRWRFIDGEKPYYKSVTGYQKCWYELNQSTLHGLTVERPLVICNGEISTIVAHYYGVPAACITAGESDISDSLIQELKEFTKAIEKLEILIALDCDEKGRKSSLAMKESLQKAGFSSVRAIDLGLSKGGDLADFCALYGELEAGYCVYPPLDNLVNCKDVKQSYEHVKIRRWEIIPASELASLPALKWIIPHEIPEDSLVVMFGPSGTGKSFLALDYSLRVAQHDRVVYMAGEGQSGYSQRIQAWCKHHKRQEGQLYICLGAVSFMDDSDLGAFIEAVSSICDNPKMIVIDTLARSMLGADENSSRDMGKFIEACEQIKYRFNCTIMIVHHTNKGGVSERGSGALRGGSDVMIKLVDEDDRIRVECDKTKDSKPFPTKYLSLLPVDIGQVDDEGNKVMPPVVVESSLIVDNGDLTTKQVQVLQALALETFEFGAQFSEIQSVIPEIDGSLLHRTISKLKKLGYVAQGAKRSPYTITNEGRKAIGLPPIDSLDSIDSPSDKTNSSLLNLSEHESKESKESTQARKWGNSASQERVKSTENGVKSTEIDRNNDSEQLRFDEIPIKSTTHYDET